MATCKIDGCINRVKARDLCATHYAPRDARPCSEHGCSAPAKARTLCARHYDRLRRLGTTTLPTLGDRFWSKVVESDATGCWLWQGARNSAGYGAFTVSTGNSQPAHRVAYELLRAPIPEGLQIDHLCNRPQCVNPWHMDPVTASVNQQRRHGRQAV